MDCHGHTHLLMHSTFCYDQPPVKITPFSQWTHHVVSVIARAKEVHSSILLLLCFLQSCVCLCALLWSIAYIIYIVCNRLFVCFLPDFQKESFTGKLLAFNSSLECAYGVATVIESFFGPARTAGIIHGWIKCQRRNSSNWLEKRFSMSIFSHRMRSCC